MNTLTEEKLKEWEKSNKCYWPSDFLSEGDVIALISSAREALRLREQLLDATAMLEHQKYCRDCAESWDSCEEGRKADAFLTEFHESLRKPKGSSSTSVAVDRADSDD